MTENKHTYYGDGVQLTAGFDLHAATPLDYRTLFTDWTNTSLSEVPADVLFVGLLASDETDKKVKILKTKPSNASTAADCTWEEIGNNSASDFDIKDLADSTNLRTTWSGKLDQLTDGNGISISNNTISVKYDNDTIKKASNGNLYVDGIPLVPIVKNRLIYSNDSENALTTDFLKINGLVVQTQEDLDICWNAGGTSMASVFNNWTKYAVAHGDSIMAVGTSGSAGETAKAGWAYDNNSGVISNYLNAERCTGFLSDVTYSKYDDTIATGVLDYYRTQGGGASGIDWLANLLAAKVDTSAGYFYAIALSLNNENNTGSDGRENITGTHTISIAAIKQPIGTSCPNGSHGSDLAQHSIFVLPTSVGLLIIPYNSTLQNGTSNGTASTIKSRVIRENDKFIIYVSDPYPSTEHGEDSSSTTVSTYDYRSWDKRHSVYKLLPIVIDLNAKTVTYVPRSDYSSPSASWTPGTAVTLTYTSNTDVCEVFEALKGSAKKGYEQCSNPGSSFRNAAENSILMDDLNDKVYDWGINSWIERSGVNVLDIFKGSRIAYNDYTHKLFYSDGEKIYEIGNNNSYSLPIASDSILGGIKVGSGLVINNGVLSTSNSGGTVTSITAGTGLEVASGDSNPITSAGTLNLKTASSSSIGGIKVNTTNSSETIESISTVTNRTYAILKQSDGTAVVNVPWTDTNTHIQADWNASTAENGAILHKPTIPSVSNQNEYITINGNGSTSGTSINTYVPVGAILMYAGDTAPDGWELCDGAMIVSKYEENQSTHVWEHIPIASNKLHLQLLYKVIGLTYADINSSKIGKHAIYVNYQPSGQSPISGYISSYATAGNIINITGSLAQSITDAGVSWFSDSYLGYTIQNSGVDITSSCEWRAYTNLPNLQLKFPLGALANGTIGNYFDSSTSSWKYYTTTLGDTGGEDTTKLLASNLPDHSHSLLVRDSNGSSSGAWEGTGDTQKTATDKTGYNIYTTGGNKVVDGTASSGQTPRTNHNNIPPFLAINFIIKY